MNEYTEAVRAFSPWATGVAVLLGSLIGGLTNFFTVRGSERQQAKREEESLHLALAAEVYSIVTIMEARDFKGELIRRRDRLKEMGDPSKKIKYCIKITPEYRTIYDANASQIGLLDKESASLIVGFHQIVHSAAHDITEGGVLANGGTASDYSETLVLIQHALLMGKLVEERADLPESFRR